MKNTFEYFDIKKSRNLVVSAELQLLGLLANYDYTIIIRSENEFVNYRTTIDFDNFR